MANEYDSSADLPTLDKGKSGDSWKKKIGRFYKGTEILFFFPIKIKRTDISHWSN